MKHHKTNLVLFIICLGLLSGCSAINTNNAKKNEEKDQKIEQKKQSCSDSDDGKDYFSKGELKLCDSTKEEPGQDVEGSIGCALHVDFCKDDQVVEYYCENNQMKAEYFKCESGCRDGVCIIEDIGLMPEKMPK